VVAASLNIKRVELLADPLSVAQLAGKANYRALGPRFGKQAPAAAKCIEGMTPQEIMTLKRDGTVTLDYNGTPTDFTFEEIKVVEAGIDPYVAGSENGLTVALDTTLTRDLQDEGLVREIINKVQNLRKKSGLEVSDRIELAVNGNEDVERSLTAFGERLSEETLARLVSSPNGESATDDFSVDGIDINIAINRQP
jgi:isoleucyl-tRNA synthetase